MHSVHLQHLTKTFQTKDAVVCAARDVTLDFTAGEITAVIGESGCGKTTLLRLIAGLEAPDAGTITIQDDAGDDTPCETAVVFQEPRLFPWLTVAQNLTLAVRHLAKPEQAQRLADVLLLTGLTAAASRYPDELSGGMAQRAGFARALIVHPDVLLLDEAFSALDALTRRRVRDEFLKIHAKRPMTTVLVTHDILEACLTARTIVRLKEGRVTKTYRVAADYPRTLATPGIGALADAIEADFFN